MDKLTKKQRGFVKDYIETENGTQSALKNYDTDSINVANQIAMDNLQKPTIQAAIQSLAERIPDELLVEKHLALLNKTDVLFGVDVPAVSKGLDMAYKLKGAYAPDKSINLNLEADITNPKARELAEKYEAELKKNL